jgi:hypothetical protein
MLHVNRKIQYVFARRQEPIDFYAYAHARAKEVILLRSINICFAFYT